MTYQEGSGRDTEERSRSLPIGRRTWIHLLGATAASVAMSGSSSASTEYRGIQFSNVVNLVDDYGADPTGSEPIDDELQNALAADTLVMVPDGEYLFAGENLISPNGNVGLLAEDGATPRFIAPDGFNDFLLNIYHLPEALFEGIDIDITKSDTTAGLRFDIEDGFHIQDVEYLGRGTHPDSNVTNALMLAVTNSGGTGVVKNVTALKGSAIDHYKNGDGRVGAFIGSDTTGTIRFEDCHFEEFGNNGLYCGRTPGDVQVIGGTYKNSNVSQVRIAGDGSYVKDALVEVDLDTYDGPPIENTDAYNTRGIVIDAGDIQQTPGALIKNSDIIFGTVEQSAGAIAVEDWNQTVDQELYVEDSTVTVDSDRKAIWSDGGPVHAYNLTIQGSAANGTTVHLYGDLASGSSFDQTCIDQTGDNCDGITANDAVDVTVSDSNVNVSGDATVEKNGGAIATSNVTYDESCGTTTSSTETALAVSTDSPTSVGSDTATLNGTLSDLGGASSVDVSFEWGKSGGSLSNSTAVQTLSETGSFSADLTGLSSDTDYEYRALAEASDGDTDTGTTVSFSTTTESVGPSIDDYNVTEAGSPNPHTEIQADWGVSDGNGDLDSVQIQVFDSDGNVVDATTHDVGGGSASGTDSFKLKHTKGQTFEVYLMVEDIENNSASESQTVTE